jgi:membrane-associated phospholipid phosphatase
MRSSWSDPTRAAVTALWAALGLAGALVGLWFLTFHVGAFERVDASALLGFQGLATHPHLGGLATRIASLCNPDPYVYLAAVPVIVALARRRPWVAAAVVVIIAGANVTTERLKPLLATVRADGLSLSLSHPASFPSGHATAAMALALCLTLASPPRWRPFIAAAGAAFAVAVCYSFLTLGWHFPSDAVAGLLIASIWTLVGFAAVRVLEGRRSGLVETERSDHPVRRAMAPSLLAAGGLALLGVAYVAMHPGGVTSYGLDHRAFVLGAFVLGAIGMCLPSAVLLTVRR